MVEIPRPLSVGSIISIRVNPSLTDAITDEIDVLMSNSETQITQDKYMAIYRAENDNTLFTRVIDENILNTFGDRVWAFRIVANFGQGIVTVATFNVSQQRWIFI